MAESDRATAIVLAAGAGRRIGIDAPKAMLEVGGRPIVSLAVEAAATATSIGAVIVAAPPGQEGAVRRLVGSAVAVVAGGATRQDSVRSALEVVPLDVGVVVVHDAARPFASSRLFDDVVSAVAGSRGEGVAGAIPVIAVADTVKRVDDGLVVGTEPREDLVLAQTPQAFDRTVLGDAHARAAAAGLMFTDDAAVLEWAGHRVRTVPGDETNFKITTPADLLRAQVWMERLRG